VLLPAGDCGYVCGVPSWLQDLLVVGGLRAAISAICKAPGFRVEA
jgi:hypothetical protein